ncbi:MAG TPA: isoprenylcysteine carboxylmethyltransferase family protein [Dehalococcoidia bacterium]|nr:isoprenylcysteine carboxylmethyltransferase family protein [Dehalococcoidia bacterium]
MSLIPEFDIGVWNAWIFVLAGLFLHMVPPMLATQFNKNLNKKFSEAPADVYLNKNERRISTISIAFLLLLFIYTVFLPLQLATPWFYTGLVIFLLAEIVYMITIFPWAATPVDKPVTTGIYRYSRHPIYLTLFFQLIGVGIATASWLFILLTVVFMILFHNSVAPEERGCLEKYGDAYREYMERTPRWIGLPKS